MKILMVHRDARLRAIFETAFAGRSICFLETDDRCRAISKLSQQHFDAVLLDEDLPETYGGSFLERLTDEFPQVPVIFLVNNPQSHSAQQGLHLGAFAVLAKPVQLKILLATLANAKWVSEFERPAAASDDSEMPAASRVSMARKTCVAGSLVAHSF